jgi:hypothetical protein
MPYTRPSRKGLPDPPPEEELDIPRSESYLHLSDLAEAEKSTVTSSQEQNIASTKADSQRSKMESDTQDKIGKLISVSSTPQSTTPASEVGVQKVQILF